MSKAMQDSVAKARGGNNIAPAIAKIGKGRRSKKTRSKPCGSWFRRARAMAEEQEAKIAKVIEDLAQLTAMEYQTIRLVVARNLGLRVHVLDHATLEQRTRG